MSKILYQNDWIMLVNFLKVLCIDIEKKKIVYRKLKKYPNDNK